MSRATDLRSAAAALRSAIPAPGGLAASGDGTRAPAEPCLHCGHRVAVRLMGCKGGHCPNCRHPYPHGDCSD